MLSHAGSGPAARPKRPRGAPVMRLGASVLLERVLALRTDGSAALVRALAAEGLAAREVTPRDLAEVSAALVVVDAAGATDAALRAARARHGAIAVVALSEAAHDPPAAAALLDEYADLVLPASAPPALLAAQLRALARLMAIEPVVDDGALLTFRGLTIDFQRREVIVGDQSIALTPTEFRVIALFARQPGRVISHGEIFRQIHGYDLSESEAKEIIKIHIWRLRTKLAAVDAEPNLIRNVRGFGYLLERREGELDSPEEAPPARDAAGGESAPGADQEPALVAATEASDTEPPVKRDET